MIALVPVHVDDQSVERAYPRHEMTVVPADDRRGQLVIGQPRRFVQALMSAFCALALPRQLVPEFFGELVADVG